MCLSEWESNYGDNGELDGAASSFRSAPAARKASLDVSVETEIPEFAAVGAEVWAYGLHGARWRAQTLQGGSRQAP